MANTRKYLLCFLSGLALLVSCSENTQKTLELRSEADLAGLRVATLSGSCYELDLSPRDDISLQIYKVDSDVLQALIDDKVDVAVSDEVLFNSVVRKESGIKIAMLGKKTFPASLMFSKENLDMVQTMNSVLERMKADGSLQELKDFWLTDRYAETDKYTHIPDETSGTPIRVASASMNAPIAFPVNGDWYGMEIDLLRELGKELHRPLEIRIYDAASAFMALKTGMADVVCGCVFITSEREEEFVFAMPYHSFRGAYFVVDRDAQRENGGMLTRLKRSIQRNLISENRWKYILDGLWETLKISLLAILLGSVLGIGLYAMTRSRRKWIRTAARAYNGFIAGIPELVLLLILFYIVFAHSGFPADLVAIIAFGMYFASGASDIYASSLNAIPHGQTEAGLALGFTRVQTFFHIVLPQALRRGLPLYKGQCVSLLKGTSIVGYIAIQDFTRAGDMIRSRTFDAVIPLLVVTVIYFLLVWLIALLLKFVYPRKNVL